MSAAPEATAPIERVTIPLVARSPAGCCDLAVMFYGRHLGPALRLGLAIAGPAVAFVYGMGRFVGTDLSLALLTGIIVSKRLGVLTVAATARETFGEPFESPEPSVRTRRTVAGRLRDVCRAALSLLAVLAGGALIAAILDDAYGTGRLAATGPTPAAGVILAVTAILFGRAQLFLHERHRLPRPVRTGLLLGLVQRTILAAPLVPLLFDESRAWGIAVAALWLPVAVGIAMGRSLATERRVLSSIDPALHTPQADAALNFGEMSQPAFVIVIAAAGLTLVALSAAEFALTTAGLPGPITGPIGDSLEWEFFEPGFAFSALGRSPLFSACALGAGLFAYQVGRVAWYFAYLDARVRRDCWDMELLLAREAKRLEGE